MPDALDALLDRWKRHELAAALAAPGDEPRPAAAPLGPAYWRALARTCAGEPWRRFTDPAWLRRVAGAA